jgi:hypothetical protein
MQMQTEGGLLFRGPPCIIYSIVHFLVLIEFVNQFIVHGMNGMKIPQTRSMQLAKLCSHTEHINKIVMYANSLYK